MNDAAAIEVLGALAQAHRLNLFRLLVRHEPEGLSASDIAAALGLAPSALSFHLANLQRAGLIVQRREGRRLVYRAQLEGMRRLMDFLTADCCGGRPELCEIDPHAHRLDKSA